LIAIKFKRVIEINCVNEKNHIGVVDAIIGAEIQQRFIELFLDENEKKTI
jgi:hypothetical protein